MPQTNRRSPAEEWSPVSDVLETSGAEGRVLPHDAELEQQVLAAMMLSRKAVSIAVSVLDELAFYSMRHRRIFGAILDLYCEDKPADLTLIADILTRKGVLEECGGPAYIADVAASVGTSANVGHHANLLVEKATRRRMIAISAKLQSEMFDETISVRDVLGGYETEIIEASLKTARGQTTHVSAAIDDALARYDDAKASPDGVTGVPSGYPHIDRLTAGFQPGELYIIAARPGMGKTAFCLNVARHVAFAFRTPVGIFSLEMQSRALATRLMCAEAKIDMQRYRTAQLDETEWAALGEAAGKLRHAPLYFDDASGTSTLDLRAKARRMYAEQGVRLIIVDYLQLMTAPSARKSDTRANEVGAIAKALKALAKDLDIPVIAAAQVKRDVENRGNARPRLSDVRESGDIEQEADLVAFIHRPEYYHQHEDDEGRDLRGVAQFLIEKQRNGPQGEVWLWWRSWCGRFEAMADDAAEEYAPVSPGPVSAPPRPDPHDVPAEPPPEEKPDELPF